ncbi:hypothetical protein B0H12DRAFT_476721 [Mycena haematopus]|nr:hypothetical protein B0H12DRAFT_476721 [Mycena haematopus]
MSRLRAFSLFSGSSFDLAAYPRVPRRFSLCALQTLASFIIFSAVDTSITLQPYKRRTTDIRAFRAASFPPSPHTLAVDQSLAPLGPLSGVRRRIDLSLTRQRSGNAPSPLHLLHYRAPRYRPCYDRRRDLEPAFLVGINLCVLMAQKLVSRIERLAIAARLLRPAHHPDDLPSLR